MTARAPDSDLAPIAIFAFRRVDLLSRVLDSLEACPEFDASPVFIFSDAAKTSSQVDDVAKVRAMIAARQRPNIQAILADANIGLAGSIIKGVTSLIETFGRVIVIEDDLIISPVTLTWFNAGLARYRDDDRVMQISAHIFNAPDLEQRSEGLFLPFSSSWGWATWKRAWDKFDTNATGWRTLDEDRALRWRFDLYGRYPYSRMLKRQMTGRLDSWAIRWYWSMFQNDGLCLYPPQSLVENLGVDNKATHGTLRRLWAKFKPTPTIPVNTRLPTLPAKVAVDAALFSHVRRAI